MILQRVASSEKGTFGCIVLDDLPFCTTMELPWRDNKVDVSCIPPGHYQCRKWTSKTLGPVIWIQDVPWRTWIYFHVANWPSDVRGCIGVGLGYGKNTTTGEYGVIESGKAMKALLASMPDTFQLEVRNP